MKRPWSVPLMSYLFIVVGVVGFIYHAGELKVESISSNLEPIWILVVRLLAIIGGVFVWRGMNWARWLLLAWILYHVILSFFHPISELVTHVLVMIIVALSLFHPKTTAYFRKK